MTPTGDAAGEPELHPDIRPLSWLVGTWSGEGRGDYPTIESFSYRETVTFGHVGKPFLAYGQRTHALDDGRPLHAESGFVRLPRPDHAELVLAHPTGVAEVAAGSFSPSTGGGTLRFRTTTIGLTATAKAITAVERDLTIDGDTLHYEVRMAAVGIALTHHLTATLVRRRA
ncbi:MAG: fatty acid-binding-like protein [Acidimicrobiales bacterium]|nr:fatty acid-binding-like protein [Acidimicrobiales bacterium]